MSGGFRDINDLSGLWLQKTTSVGGGFIGIEHLTGVWIWGAPPGIPPEPPAGISFTGFMNSNVGRLKTI